MRTRRKKHAAVFFAVWFVLAACNTIPAPGAGFPPSPAYADSSSPDGAEGFTVPENPMVFDFDALSEDFPRGAWTVNKLADRYGEPVSVDANYLSGYDIVFVNVQFADFTVHFYFAFSERFSFYREGLDEGAYTLDEGDKEIELTVLALRIKGGAFVFPYDIAIGESTKEQVANAYPEDTAYRYISKEAGIDLLSYAYGFRDEEGNLPNAHEPGSGGIDYLFDESGTLEHVLIAWFSMDL